jgi:hypothetical protein
MKTLELREPAVISSKAASVLVASLALGLIEATSQDAMSWHEAEDVLLRGDLALRLQECGLNKKLTSLLHGLCDIGALLRDGQEKHFVNERKRIHADLIQFVQITKYTPAGPWLKAVD